MKYFFVLFFTLFLVFSFSFPALADDPLVTPTPEVTENVVVSETPVPEQSPVVSISPDTVTSQTDLLQQQLVVLGNIQGYLIFGLVVLLCFFAYKFFRMFF